ncbi:MAG TPA: hypothetical protein VGC38_05655 [Pseudolabrys sp.]
MTIKPDSQVIALAAPDSRTNYAARNEALRQENARLKDLVVQLSAIVAKYVAARK